jgi:hypothetical protein
MLKAPKMFVVDYPVNSTGSCGYGTTNMLGAYWLENAFVIGVAGLLSVLSFVFIESPSIEARKVFKNKYAVAK